MSVMRFDDLHCVEPGFVNPRTTTGLDREALRELAVNIGLHGLRNALIVRSSGLILAGQRRYHALAMLRGWDRGYDWHELTDEFGLDHVAAVRVRVQALLEAVPVSVNDTADAEGLALADNLQRRDLSAYEIAAYVVAMAERHTGVAIARLVGKSPAWVSKHLNAWRGLTEAGRAAWRNGTLTFEQVQHLATLTPEKQAIELAGGVPRRGAANRPGIEVIKEALAVVHERVQRGDDRTFSREDGFAVGVLDVLRWATGAPPSAALADLLGDGQ